jgi:hypothetical protein
MDDSRRDRVAPDKAGTAPAFPLTVSRRPQRRGQMPPLERLCEVAHATAHGDITASAIDGLMLGDAFVKCVIGDPKVQAYATWVYSEFGVKFPSSPNVSQVYGPPVIREGNKWPVILDARDICSDFERAHRDLSHLTSESSPLFHAAQSLADRHRAFFDLLRNSDVIAKGTSEATGAPVSVQSDQWSRPDRYLDVRLSDLVVVVDNGSWALRRMVSGLKVSLPAGSNGEVTRRVKGLPTATGLAVAMPTTRRQSTKAASVQGVLESAGYYPNRNGLTLGQLRDVVIRECGGYTLPRERAALKKMIERLYG